MQPLSHPSWRAQACEPASVPCLAPEREELHEGHTSGPDCTASLLVGNSVREGTLLKVAHTCALLPLLSPVLLWQGAT